MKILILSLLLLFSLPTLATTTEGSLLVTVTILPPTPEVLVENGVVSITNEEYFTGSIERVISGNIEYITISY